MLSEEEFLSDYGIRSLSKHHKQHPYSMVVNSQKFEVSHIPGDSDSGLFGGNSNWRGPIWYAVNFLLVESLLRFYMFYGDSFKVECPTGSGVEMHLGQVAEELQHRLTQLFVRGYDGRRAINGGRWRARRTRLPRSVGRARRATLRCRLRRRLGAGRRREGGGLLGWPLLSWLIPRS